MLQGSLGSGMRTSAPSSALTSCLHPIPLLARRLSLNQHKNISIKQAAAPKESNGSNLATRSSTDSDDELAVSLNERIMSGNYTVESGSKMEKLTRPLRKSMGAKDQSSASE